MTYYLGKRSRSELVGVHPQLVKCVEEAISVTSVDFSVFDGIRTIQQQREYVDRGVSKTLRSKHLKQESTGYGHAVDLVPYLNGKLRWELKPLMHIASAMRWAAVTSSVTIRWGGCWAVINDIGPGHANMEAAVNQYIDIRRSQGKTPFVDAPHFEIIV